MAALEPVLRAANRTWWDFEISRCEVRLIQHTPGKRFWIRADLHAANATTKLGITCQLSDGDTDYSGGDLYCYPGMIDPMSNNGSRYTAPRDRGSVTVWRLGRCTRFGPSSRGFMRRWCCRCTAPGRSADRRHLAPLPGR
jgi:hypothetical protein